MNWSRCRSQFYPQGSDGCFFGKAVFLEVNIQRDESKERFWSVTIWLPFLSLQDCTYQFGVVLSSLENSLL